MKTFVEPEHFTPEQRQLVLGALRKRSPRPILIGEVTFMLESWATLRWTESMLEEMVKDGVLRHLTREEKRNFDVRHGYLPV